MCGVLLSELQRRVSEKMNVLCQLNTVPKKLQLAVAGIEDKSCLTSWGPTKLLWWIHRKRKCLSRSIVAHSGSF